MVTFGPCNSVPHYSPAALYLLLHTSPCDSLLWYAVVLPVTFLRTEDGAYRTSQTSVIDLLRSIRTFRLFNMRYLMKTYLPTSYTFPYLFEGYEKWTTSLLYQLY